MVKEEPKVKRGQIWTADLNPGFGRELHKKRPVLIVSNDTINTYSPTLIILPITSQVSPLGPEKILLPKKGTGLHRKSAVLVLGIRNIDIDRLLRKVGTIDDEKMMEIEEALKIVLNLETRN